MEGWVGFRAFVCRYEAAAHKRGELLAVVFWFWNNGRKLPFLRVPLEKKNQNEKDI